MVIGVIAKFQSQSGEYCPIHKTRNQKGDYGWWCALCHAELLNSYDYHVYCPVCKHSTTIYFPIGTKPILTGEMCEYCHTLLKEG